MKIRFLIIVVGQLMVNPTASIVPKMITWHQSCASPAQSGAT